MKNLFFMLSALVSLSAFANGPGDLLDSSEAAIKAGVQACGLSMVNGQDPTLDYQIRARRVDYVIVTTRNGYVQPGVLVDRDINNYGGQGGLTLTYSRTNGGLIMNLSRTYDFNDFAVDTAYQGRVAFSNSYFYGQDLTTRYYVKQYRGGDVEVNSINFTNFVNTEIVNAFVARVCQDGNTGFKK